MHFFGRANSKLERASIEKSAPSREDYAQGAGICNMSSTSTRMAHGRNLVHNRLDRAERIMVIGVADGSRTRRTGFCVTPPAYTVPRHRQAVNTNSPARTTHQ